MRCEWIMMCINGGLAFLRLNRRTTKPWGANQRQDNTWLAKGQKSDWPSVLSLAWVVFYIWKGAAHPRKMLPCMYFQCASSWYMTRLSSSCRATCCAETPPGAGIAQLVVLGLAVQGVAGSILLWGHFPVEGIFPLELTWVQTPFPPKFLQMRV